jgi:hypothetical protein
MELPGGAWIVRGLLVVSFATWVPLAGSAQSRRNAWPPEHDDALRRAQVWTDPAGPIESASLAANPDDRFRADQVVGCRFEPVKASGNSAKFDCALPDGEVVKIKYGRDNPEVFAEVIATRLLSALGFPSDRMYVVAAVECAGCPERPFEASQCLGTQKGTIESCIGKLDYAAVRRLPDAVIELPVPGRRIEARRLEGWGWKELDKVDPAAGGAPRAHVDALRLMAVFLAHWDNKPENQRLLCLGEKDGNTTCARPLAMVQDVGATFGPNKLNLTGWRNAPIWADTATCTVSMRALPYGGSSFPDVRISEAGRHFLAERLGRLTRAQVHDLFTGARIERYEPIDEASRDVDRWVSVFMDKVAAIVDRPSCPGT